MLDEFRPGRTIYLPGATGEILGLAGMLAANPDHMAGVHVLGCPLPGLNHTDYAALAPGARQTLFLASPAISASLASGRSRLLPLAYSSIALWFAHEAEIDIAFAHVAPPDEDGLCSLGIAADFTPIAWARAKRRVLVINPQMPYLRHGPRIALSEADAVHVFEGPLVTVADTQSSPDAVTAAAIAAQLIPDGAALQIGIGGAPGALWAALASHRGLKLRSGLVAAAFAELEGKGSWAADVEHVAGIAAGTVDFYRWLADYGGLRLADARETHDVARLEREPRFFSVNGALEVDLFGQVNLEWQGGKLVSGVGGAPDFARAAMRSPGGGAIIVMPSAAKGGRLSRIVPRLTAPAVSLGRADVDIVVTEQGAARLRGKSLDERAEALIAIADPAHRSALDATWLEMRRDMARPKSATE